MTRVTRAAAARAQQEQQQDQPAITDNQNTIKSLVKDKKYLIGMDESIEIIDPCLSVKVDADIKEQIIEPTLTKKKSKKGAKKGKKIKAEGEVVVVEVQEVEMPAVDAIGDKDALVEAIVPAAPNDASEKASVEVASPVKEAAIIETSTGQPTESNTSKVNAREEVEKQPQQENVATAERQAEVDSALAALEGRAATEATINLSSTPSKVLPMSPGIASPTSRDAIDEIDALEDALEEIGRSLPNVALSPEKPRPRQGQMPKDKTRQSTGATKAAKPVVAKPQPKTANPAAIQPAMKPKVSSSLLSTTQPSAAARQRPSPTTQPNRSVSSSASATKRQSVVAAKDTPDVNAAKKPVDYPASKRRPISMQFPPPPAPIKSAKAPTKPTFTLPGEAISARKKALHEAKLKKEEEELQRRRSFKPRAVPDSIRARPSSMIVKQNASSRARMSVIGGVAGSMSDSKENMSPANTSLKRSNTTTAAAARTGHRATTTPRSTMASSVSKASANTGIKRDGSSLKVSGPPKASVQTKRASVLAPHRQSLNMSMGPVAAPRPKSMMLSSSQRPLTGTRPTAAEAQALKAKAKSVYNRDCNGGDIHQRERREKEEAAKRARAEAAEKGRQASREWAEKQRKKLAEVKMAQQQRQQTPIAA